MPGIRKTILWIAILAISLAIAAPASAETSIDAFVSGLPASDAQTARALASHLDGQHAVVIRAANSDKSFEEASSAAEKAKTMLEQSAQALAAAREAHDNAVTRLGQTEQFVKELIASKATMDAYDSASQRYAVAQEREQKASDALDTANAELLDAHALAEEVLHEMEDVEGKFAQSTEALTALRAEVKALGEKKPSPEATEEEVAEAAKWLATRTADLEDAEKAGEALAQQLESAKEQSRLGRDKASAAQSAADAALAAENKALAAVELAAKELGGIEPDYKKIQLTREELNEASEKAETERVAAVADLDKLRLALEAAATAQSNSASASDKAAAEFEAAQAEQSSAAEALADLTARWAKYQQYTGKAADGVVFPAFDLLAAEEAAPDIYTVYLTGVDVYIFRGGKELARMECLKGKHLGVMDLTRNGRGTLALRYVAWNGTTRMQSLGADALVLFTGAYDTLTISSKLRKTTQFLGESCQVRTVMMHPNTTVIHFGQENPLRHAPAK